MRFKDRVVIVSGAGSIRVGMGNGKAAAIAFAKEGAKVVAVDMNLAAAQETVRIIEENGGECTALQADVAREAEAKKAVESTIAKYGRLDILFNNVGIGSGGTGLKVTEAEWDSVMGVNLKSVLFMSKYAAPEM